MDWDEALDCVGGRCFACFGGDVDVRYTDSAGSRRSRLRSTGAEEYMVVANSIAAQFRRKSIKIADGL